MDTGEHIKNNTDDDSQSSAVFGRMRKHKDPLISALNQRVLGSNPSASTIFPLQKTLTKERLNGELVLPLSSFHLNSNMLAGYDTANHPVATA